MCVCDEVVDFLLVVAEEGLDVCGPDVACALSLWEDEVEEETEADSRVEGKPGEEGEVGFEEKEEGEGRPVVQPGGKKGQRGGADGFIGEVEGEED